MTNDLSVGIYLGANVGIHPEYEKAVIELGRGLVTLGYTLVYGGAAIGLMGLLAETVKACGGHVTGIITHHLLEREILFPHADEIIVVDSMYERKRLIHEKSSRFIVMPGGLGTLDELFETWCNIKIGILQKPMGFINIQGYFDALIQFVRHSAAEGFLTESHFNIPDLYPDVATCLESLSTCPVDG